jgi:hypothetical protein
MGPAADPCHDRCLQAANTRLKIALMAAAKGLPEERCVGSDRTEP